MGAGPSLPQEAVFGLAITTVIRQPSSGLRYSEFTIVAQLFVDCKLRCRVEQWPCVSQARKYCVESPATSGMRGGEGWPCEVVSLLSSPFGGFWRRVLQPAEGPGLVALGSFPISCWPPDLQALSLMHTFSALAVLGPCGEGGGGLALGENAGSLGLGPSTGSASLGEYATIESRDSYLPGR